MPGWYFRAVDIALPSPRVIATSITTRAWRRSRRDMRQCKWEEAMPLLLRGIAMLCVLLGPGSRSTALAQDYPNRTVTLIVPWAAGGAVDTVARIVAPKLSERLGVSVIVENRPGGGSTIGTALGAKVAPDGYTLGIPGSG